MRNCDINIESKRRFIDPTLHSRIKFSAVSDFRSALLNQQWDLAVRNFKILENKFKRIKFF